MTTLPFAHSRHILPRKREKYSVGTERRPPQQIQRTVVTACS